MNAAMLVTYPLGPWDDLSANTSPMQPHVRDYLYAGLLGATPVFVIVGVVMFWRASTFEGYIGALIVLTLAACSFLGARELKPAEVSALFDHLRRKKHNQDGPAAPQQ
jgi:hypothetical protein